MPRSVHSYICYIRVYWHVPLLSPRTESNSQCYLETQWGTPEGVPCAMLLQNAVVQGHVTPGAHSHTGVSSCTHHEKHHLKWSHSSLWPVTHECSGQTMALWQASGFAPPLQTQWEPEACRKHPSRLLGVIFVSAACWKWLWFISGI